MFRYLLALVLLASPASAQWGGQANIVNVVNPQIAGNAAIPGAPAIDDNFAAWKCAEWGHQVPCTNHIAVTRAAVAWCPTRGGLLVQVPSGIPCFTDLGLWVNQSNATNQTLQSRDLSQAVWVKAGVTTGTGIGMDGLTCSNCQVTATGVASSCAATCTVLQTCQAGALCTNNAQHVTVRVQRVTGSGTVSMTADGSTFTALTSAICKKNDGTASNLITDQYVTCVIQQTLATPIVGIQFGTLNDVVNLDFVTDYRITGALVTMPVVTTTVTATMAIDNIATAGVVGGSSTNTNYLSNVAGSAFIQTSSMAAASGQMLSMSAITDRPFNIGSNTTTRLLASNTAAANTTGNSLTWQSAVGAKGASAWDGTSGIVSGGGAAVTTAAAAMAATTTSYIGSTNATTPQGGPLARLALWPGIKLPAAQLQGLSTPPNFGNYP